MKLNLWFINMPSQKIKQKTNIKININLAEKRKRRKQRKRRTATSNSQTTAQQLLARQPIVINNTRPLPENNNGNILDVIRNQQSTINKHGELIKSGMSNLEFVNNVLKGNYQPLKTEYTTPQKEYTTPMKRKIKIKKETIRPETPPIEETVAPVKSGSTPPSSPKYAHIAQKAFGNQRSETKKFVKDIYDNYFRDKTNEQIEHEYKDQFGELHGNVKTREGRIGALIEKRIGNVLTSRGGGANPIFFPQEEAPNLTDPPQDEPAGLLDDVEN